MEILIKNYLFLNGIFSAQSSEQTLLMMVLHRGTDLLLLSPFITDDDDFLFNVETQHEVEESMC